MTTWQLIRWEYRLRRACGWSRIRSAIEALKPAPF